MRQQLQTLGVLRFTGHEHLNGYLAVPVLGLEDGAQPEQSGQVMQLYGRRMQPNNKLHNQLRHFYLATPSRGVWNEAALLTSLEVILCESLIDAMTFWCAGFRNVISAYGVNGFSQDHWQALKHHGTQRVMIAFDRASAGDTAVEKLAEELHSAGIEVFRLLFPQGMDANAFALRVENPAQALGELLQQALWQGKGTPVWVAPETTFPLAAAPQATAAVALSPEIYASERVLPPVPGVPVPESEIQIDQFSENAQGDLLLAVAVRRWRVRGWKKNRGPEQMRVNVQVRREVAEDHAPGREAA